MLTLLETLIAFVAIMLTISLLVKSLTSVVKNHVDYYTDHLKEEALRLAGMLVDGDEAAKALTNGVDWQKVGDELLTVEHFKAILDRVCPGVSLPDPSVFKAAQQRVKWVFERRMKNLTLALGVALCLLLNINAFRLWDSLYKDGQIRAAFTSNTYIESVLKKSNTEEGQTESTEDSLQKQRQELRKDLMQLTSDVSFGLGEVWSKKPLETKKPARYFLIEFFGSLFTGILVSIGAPYWHDLLRSLAGLRGAATGKAGLGG